MADAYNKDEMNRRMNGAVATLKSEFRCEFSEAG